jgi:hypothetical protein
MKLLHAFKNICCYCFVLALPVGIYHGDPDSIDYQFGIHAGGGQVASVITGCEGAKKAKGSKFVDLAGEGYMRLPPRTNSPIVVGVRAGYWHSNLSLITSHYEYPDRTYPLIPLDYSFQYVNPCISIETRYVGFGVGRVFGDVPLEFQNGEIDTADHFSGHLRFGLMRGVNISMSFMENSPYVSGGGYFDLALSFPIGGKARTRMGISGGPYYTVGFLQQNRIQIKNNFAVDFNWRVGSTAGEFEYGISAGIVYTFRRR